MMCFDSTFSSETGQAQKHVHLIGLSCPSLALEQTAWASKCIALCSLRNCLERALQKNGGYPSASDYEMDGWTRPCQVRTARFTLSRVATIRRLGRSRSREEPPVGTGRGSSTLGLLLRHPAHSLIARCAAQGAQTRGLARQSFPSRSPLAAPPAG